MQRRSRRPPRRVRLSWQEAATVIVRHPEVVAWQGFRWDPQCPCRLCTNGLGDDEKLALELDEQGAPVWPLNVRRVPADGAEPDLTSEAFDPGQIDAFQIDG